MTSRRSTAMAGGALRAGMRVATTALTAVNAASAGYLGVLTLAGIARRRPSAPTDVPPSTRFVIMVPAHDEEAVIADALASMTELRYDRTMYDVHVVADNCTDGTSDIVRSCGWTVHERVAPDDPGKGPALNWLFERLDRAGSTFDVAIVVDADSVLDAGLPHGDGCGVRRRRIGRAGLLLRSRPGDVVSSRVAVRSARCSPSPPAARSRRESARHVACTGTAWHFAATC